MFHVISFFMYLDKRYFSLLFFQTSRRCHWSWNVDEARISLYCIVSGVISNLPWFMDLTFQISMQYCSLQHWTLLLSPVPSIAGYCFCFGSISSFFLELFLHWSSVAYLTPTNLGSSSFSVLSFAFSCCSWGSQGTNTEVVCHSLLQWTTFCQTSPPRPIHLGWPHTAWLSFTELDKAVVCVIRRFREGFLRSGLISGWKVVELDRERERNYA